MQPVFQRDPHRVRIARRQRRDQQRRTLDIENRIRPRNKSPQQNRASLRRRNHKIRHDHRHPEFLRQRHPHRPHRSARIHRASHDPAQHTGRRIIRMPLDPRHLIQNSGPVPPPPRITTPAVSAAALDLAPSPTGIALTISSSTGSPTEICRIKLSSPVREINSASRPDTRIDHRSARRYPAFQKHIQRHRQRIEPRPPDSRSTPAPAPSESHPSIDTLRASRADR